MAAEPVPQQEAQQAARAGAGGVAALQALEAALASGDPQRIVGTAQLFGPWTVQAVQVAPEEALAAIRSRLQGMGMQPQDVPISGPGTGFFEQAGAGLQEGLPGLYMTPLALPGAAAPRGLRGTAGRLAGGAVGPALGMVGGSLMLRAARPASVALARLLAGLGFGTGEAGTVAAGQAMQGVPLDPTAIGTAGALGGLLGGAVMARPLVGPIRAGRAAFRQATRPTGIPQGVDPRQLVEIAGQGVFRPPPGMRPVGMLRGPGPRLAMGRPAKEFRRALRGEERAFVRRGIEAGQPGQVFPPPPPAKPPRPVKGQAPAPGTQLAPGTQNVSLTGQAVTQTQARQPISARLVALREQTAAENLRRTRAAADLAEQKLKERLRSVPPPPRKP